MVGFPGVSKNRKHHGAMVIFHRPQKSFNMFSEGGTACERCTWFTVLFLLADSRGRVKPIVFCRLSLTVPFFPLFVSIFDRARAA